MKPFDRRSLQLNEGVLREATPDDRMILWLPRGGDGSFRYWERVVGVAGAAVLQEQGLRAMPATSIGARQRVRGLLGKLIPRLGGQAAARVLTLPDGGSAEQWGERRTDLMLVWAVDEADPLDESRIRARWPASRGVEPIGPHLFLASGVESQLPKDEAEPVLLEGSPRELAEQLLSAARRAGDPRGETTALTDMGILCAREGDAPGAIALLEENLPKVRQLNDPSWESDVLIHLGSSLLAVGQPDRGFRLMEEGLALAHGCGDPYAEKAALERLGGAHAHLRDASRSLSCYERALVLAQGVDDRQNVAELLWSLAIQHAELGQRDRAVARGQEAIDLWARMGKPQARWFDEHLKNYRAGDAAIQTGPPGNPQPGPAYPTSGPGLLSMAYSAVGAMAKFLGSGLKTADRETVQQRLRTCATCEHHTGVRCRLCGCITSVKARMLHEECPIAKWPS